MQLIHKGSCISQVQTELTKSNVPNKDALIASGIEAAWRLSDWGALEQFSSNSVKDTFESSLGRLLNMLGKKDVESFEDMWARFLEKDHEPSSFGTYERDYDFYVKLHIKRDIGKLWEVIKVNDYMNGQVSVKSLVNFWGEDWNNKTKHSDKRINSQCSCNID